MEMFKGSREGKVRRIQSEKGKQRMNVIYKTWTSKSSFFSSSYYLSRFPHNFRFNWNEPYGKER